MKEPDYKPLYTFLDELAAKFPIYIDATDTEDFIYLNMIQANTPKQGIGTQVMKSFCEYLDERQLPCRLTIDTNYGTSYWTLQKFYTRLGFEAYDEQGIELIRYPTGYLEHLKTL